MIPTVCHSGKGPTIEIVKILVSVRAGEKGVEIEMNG
jgi:hypothetical protein